MSNKKSVITRYSKVNKYLYMFPSALLGVNQLINNNLCCLIESIIYFLHPQHLVSCLKLFGYAFLFGKLFYQPKEHILCLLDDTVCGNRILA